MRYNNLKRMAERQGRTVRDILIETYGRYGSQTRAAAELQISQSRLSQLIKEHKLKEKTILVPMEGDAS